MTGKEFDELRQLFEKYRTNLLVGKNKEYGEQLERFSNIKEIAKIAGETPQKVALILMLKHFVKIRNICIGDIKNDYNLEKEKLLEAFSDTENYLDIIYGMTLERNSSYVASIEMLKTLNKEPLDK